VYHGGFCAAETRVQISQKLQHIEQRGKRKKVYSCIMEGSAPHCNTFARIYLTYVISTPLSLVTSSNTHCNKHCNTLCNTSTRTCLTYLLPNPLSPVASSNTRCSTHYTTFCNASTRTYLTYVLPTPLSPVASSNLHCNTHCKPSATHPHELASRMCFSLPYRLLLLLHFLGHNVHHIPTSHQLYICRRNKDVRLISI